MAYLCVAINGVTASMVAKKFDMKFWRCDIEAVLLLHIIAACVALGSQREGFAEREKKMRSKKRRKFGIERF